MGGEGGRALPQDWGEHGGGGALFLKFGRYADSNLMRGVFTNN